VDVAVYHDHHQADPGAHFQTPEHPLICSDVVPKGNSPAMADEYEPPRLHRLSTWAADRASWRTIGWTILATGAAVPGMMLATPGAYFGSMPHDSLSMVDIGYRMASGQIPGRDFHSAFGIMFQVQMGLAYQLGHTVSATLEWATTLFFIASAACVAYVARTRLSNLGALGVILAVIMIGGAPFARADQNLAGATFAMLYNREGWALLLLLFLFWLTPRRPVAPWAEGLMMGLLTGASLYLKVSYGGVALLFCALLALLRPTARAPLVIAAGCVALLACGLELMWGPGFNLGYLADIIAVARSGGSRAAHIAVNLFDARHELAFALVMAPLIAWRPKPPALADMVFVVFCGVASLLIVWQNAQVQGLYLLWAALAALLEPRLAEDERVPGAPPPWHAGVVYAAWAVLSLSPNALTLIEYAFGAASTPPAAPGVAPISDLRFGAPHKARRTRGNDAVYGDEYARSLVDGVRLLQACPTRSGVYTVDLFEPFSLLTGRPPNHAWTWHDPGHSFNRAVHPAAAAEFSGVDCVMVPKAPNKPDSTQELLAIYGPYIGATFPRVLESADWTLRMRASPSAGGPPSGAP
jgi:hypothetical protein